MEEKCWERFAHPSYTLEAVSSHPFLNSTWNSLVLVFIKQVFMDESESGHTAEHRKTPIP